MKVCCPLSDAMLVKGSLFGCIPVPRFQQGTMPVMGVGYCDVQKDITAGGFWGYSVTLSFYARISYGSRIVLWSRKK